MHGSSRWQELRASVGPACRNAAFPIHRVPTGCGASSGLEDAGMCSPAAWAMPLPQASLRILGMDPSQCSTRPYWDAGGQCWGCCTHPTPLQGTWDRVPRLVGTQGPRAWSCTAPPASPREGGRAAPGTAPAWDLELDPKAPSGIVALTQHLCFLCRRL